MSKIPDPGYTLAYLRDRERHGQPAGCDCRGARFANEVGAVLVRLVHLLEAGGVIGADEADLIFGVASADVA